MSELARVGGQNLSRMQLRARIRPDEPSEVAAPVGLQSTAAERVAVVVLLVSCPVLSGPVLSCPALPCLVYIVHRIQLCMASRM